MEKYEYKIVRPLQITEKILNELGKDGWKLVCVSARLGIFIRKAEHSHYRQRKNMVSEFGPVM